MLPKFSTGTALILLCAHPLQPVFAATTSDNAALDPVVVEGKRAKLSELRHQIVDLEDRFLDRYNELNTVPDFDVHCSVEAPIGTLLKGRSCRAVYEIRALQEEGQRAFQFRQFLHEQFEKNAPDPMTQGGPPVPSVAAIKMREPAYKRNMLEVTRRDAGLQQLLRERYEAQQHYRELRREVFRGEGSRNRERAAHPATSAPTSPDSR